MESVIVDDLLLNAEEPTFIEPTDILETDEFTSLVEDPIMKHLSNVDYSLNSPLIGDEIDDLIDWLRGYPPVLRWNQSKWGRIKNTLKPFIKGNRLIKTEKFAEWFGLFNLNMNPKITQEFDDIIRRASKCEIITQPVVHAFIKGWLGKSINTSHIDRNNLKLIERKWGYYFWELHLTTLLLNCTTIAERKFLEESTKAIFIENPNNHHYFKLKTPNFGHMIICEGFVLFIDHQLLIDRSTILMMKDTYIARYNTLSALANRLDSLFPSNALSLMTTLYNIGDNILATGGREGYNCIKMLEPFCNMRMVTLAQNFRPLIPIPNDFRNHLLTTVNEQRAITPFIQDLFDFINSQTDVEMLLTMYGSFRHWGHPFIDYLQGLEKLYEQTTMHKEIDEVYAEVLASDLAFLVIRSQFRKNKKWPVDETRVGRRNLLKTYITSNTWPPNNIIHDFGNKWHKLPLIKCFDIPDVIDPSVIYSDKSHSFTRSELLKHLKKNPCGHIPSHKVLSSLLSNPATNWPIFLQYINDFGIDEDHLIIGLKAKERELKIIGRFFALMSWQIRDYFVITEYLIKLHFVPLFKGLTMADDFTTVIGKMLENSSNQGESDYKQITIADHIDYTKWNNHQRGKANNPVFKVMGQFLGYPNLITRTHEIFEKSWIYYNNRGDLLGIDASNNLMNKTEKRVCWLGQQGGLEGLRQKGWSICNLLVLRREGYSLNTKIKVLAQGDNQVICSLYRIQQFRTEAQLNSNINSIMLNNRMLLNKIADGTRKLGLIINKDETIKSSEFLNYGKNIIFRGNIRNLETKRWSRVNCVTNDQLPTMANVISTTTSNALTVSHYSDSPINSMYYYNFIAHFVRIICEFHNPALRGPVQKMLKLQANDLMTKGYLFKTLFLDPSMGGVCGMSLTRFIVRMFPDPISESLTFLKLVYENILDEQFKILIPQYGYPKIKQEMVPNISKLLEDPLSLNIARGIDANTMIKEAIKTSLFRSQMEIKNLIIRSAVQHRRETEPAFLSHLRSITPLFPRFLSEYRAGTYLGITDSMIELFQNSKTIRNQFKRALSIKYDQIIIAAEIYSLKCLIKQDLKIKIPMWKCSSSHADHLRFLSWGQKVYGATIPHPAELFHIPIQFRGECEPCLGSFPNRLYISILVPSGFKDLKTIRGSCAAYLGSATLESTSILQSWEKETKIPLLKRATSLRNAIGWFIDYNSPLAHSILNNLRALTGEDWSQNLEGFKRTGSALHRFNCSRQSNGGYSAQNPSKLTRMLATTNSLLELGDKNYDFMFQNCILNSLISTGEIHHYDQEHGFYHHHIKCKDCLREIDEIKINCNYAYQHPDVHNLLKDWKPDNASWGVINVTLSIPSRNWNRLTRPQKSFQIAQAQGFVFGDSVWGSSSLYEDPALFPLTIRNKITPREYMRGLIVGVIRSSALSILHQRGLTSSRSYHRHIIGHATLTIGKLANNLNLINIWREPQFLRLFASIPHKIPPSYPIITEDITRLGSDYMKYELSNFGSRYLSEHIGFQPIWIFADIYKSSIVGLIGISDRFMKVLREPHLSKRIREYIAGLRDLSTQLRSLDDAPENLHTIIQPLLENLILTDQEVRHAVRLIEGETIYFEDNRSLNWSNEDPGWANFIPVNYLTINNWVNIPELYKDRYQNPLISGLRIAQLATGAHYKVHAILNRLTLPIQDGLIGGDGSGGLTALFLRKYRTSKAIFNTLCEFSKVNLKGNTPSPPSAILHCLTDPERCVNLNTCWLEPNDLRLDTTWRNFVKLKTDFQLHLNLLIFDMEVVDIESINLIEDNLVRWYEILCEHQSVIIFKTYLTRIFSTHNNILNKLAGAFENIELATTATTSSQSSEVYVIFQNPTQRGLIRQTTFLDYNDLYENRFLFPYYQTEENEFYRALQIKRQDLIRGIPRELIPEKDHQLMNLLVSFGIRTDLCYRYSTELTANPTSLNYVILLFSLVTHGIVPYSITYTKKVFIPSDGVIRSLGTWISGFFIWLGFELNNFPVTKLGQSFINYYFPFYMSKSPPENRYFQSQFKLHPIPDSISKFIQLDDQMASIGSVIRTLRRIFYNLDLVIDIPTINLLLKEYNPGITINIFDRNTGLFSLYLNPTIIFESVPPERISILLDNPMIEDDDETENYYIRE
nr:putative L protein [Aksy-Durug Melophagus sigmavirus]